jgi:hypothetical protein
MKQQLLFWLATLFYLPTVLATGFSSPTNGVYLAITEDMPMSGLPGTNEPFKSNDELVWAAYCSNTGKVSLSYPIDRAYGVKIKMFGPDSQEVEKTSLGKMYGSRWDDLHSYKDARLQPFIAEGSFEDNHGEACCGILPSAQELFKMSKPGIYTMEIEIQLFRHVPTQDTEVWRRNLLRFTPIKIKVERTRLQT